MTDEPEPYDHYRAGPDAPIPAGVYRVVGLPNGTVTLLRVGDADGRRRVTGRIESVDRDTLATMDPADDPDSGVGLRDLIDPLVAPCRLLYWNVR